MSSILMHHHFLTSVCFLSVGTVCCSAVHLISVVFFFFYHSVILSTHCLLLPSQTQLRHEQLFDEQFDCFSTKEVCLIDSQRAFPALDFIEFPYVTI